MHRGGAYRDNNPGRGDLCHVMHRATAEQGRVRTAVQAARDRSGRGAPDPIPAARATLTGHLPRGGGADLAEPGTCAPAPGPSWPTAHDPHARSLSPHPCHGLRRVRARGAHAGPDQRNHRAQARARKCGGDRRGGAAHRRGRGEQASPGSRAGCPRRTPRQLRRPRGAGPAPRRSGRSRNSGPFAYGHGLRCGNQPPRATEREAGI